MAKNLKQSIARQHLTIGLIAASMCLSLPVNVKAQESVAFTSPPSSVFGLTHGTLMPQSTFQSYVGSTQTTRGSSNGQTGRQVYYGGVRYRNLGPLEFGANFSVFDDAPANSISGRLDSLTYLGVGVDLKYQLHNSNIFSAAVVGGVEGVYYSRGGTLTTQSDVPDADKDTVFATTISVPITYQVTNPFWITGEIGYTHAASTVAGQRGFGGRAFVSGGLTYQVGNRTLYYGSVKALARDFDDGIDAQDQGGADFIYTLGAQYALTPQAAANFYVTNAFSVSATGDDLLFFPDKKDLVFGLKLSYVPSGRGTRDTARTYRTANRVQGSDTRLRDGFTIKAPHTLAADRFNTSVSYGSAGQTEIAVYYAPDPDIQLEFSLENFALKIGSSFRSEAVEDERFMVGGRWQAMDEAYGQPLNLSLGLAASRDIQKPAIGSLFAEISASKTFTNGALTLNARSAIYAAETLVGAGIMYSHNFSDTITAIGEFTAVQSDKPVWAVGLRHSPRTLPFSIDLYASNAAGLNGIGSLLSNNDAQVGISLNWEAGLDLF
jgi:hypothetical protein